VTAGSTFRTLAATIYWCGKESSPQDVAREILRRSAEPRMHCRPIAEVCAEMAGPVPLVLDPEAMALAEMVMAATPP
jgi:hypothetical protein